MSLDPDTLKPRQTSLRDMYEGDDDHEAEDGSEMIVSHPVSEAIDHESAPEVSSLVRSGRHWSMPSVLPVPV
jgi:hypothetical protein